MCLCMGVLCFTFMVAPAENAAPGRRTSGVLKDESYAIAAGKTVYILSLRDLEPQ